MEQTSGTSTPTGAPPPAPRPKVNDLPELPDEGASSSQTPGKVAVDENTDISTLTPSQLYELNQELLNDSTSSDRPLISPVAPMEVLREEYERGSQSFVRQIDFLLKKGYHGIRRTRGDGDCFYRSLAFAYIERILSSADRPLAVMTAISTLDAALPMLDAAGFQKMVYEDFYEVFADLIKAIETPGPEGKTLSHETLLQSFQNPEVSNYVVVFLRLLASAQIRTDPESYAPFLFHPDLGESMTPREFCESFVEAVGKEADHVQVTALSRALKINVSVAYLDGHSADGHVDFVEFVNARDEKEPPLVLLYRPGHYDILDNGAIEGLTL
ncbi:cysteine proteinase [Dentipellis sp. KUC8613]|nr:cysteine proteinase [Dentipellis sp. KUC8613]